VVEFVPQLIYIYDPILIGAVCPGDPKSHRKTPRPHEQPNIGVQKLPATYTYSFGAASTTVVLQAIGRIIINSINQACGIGGIYHRISLRTENFLENVTVPWEPQVSPAKDDSIGMKKEVPENVVMLVPFCQ